MVRKAYGISVRHCVYMQKGTKPTNMKVHPFNGSVPYLDVYSLESKMFSQYAKREFSNLSKKDDILMIWDGSRSGHVFLGLEGAVGSTLMCITPIGLMQKYLYYFLKSKFRLFNNNLTGSGIPHMNTDLFLDTQIPYISIEEQKLVIDSIEQKMLQNAFLLQSQADNIKRLALTADLDFSDKESDVETLLDNFRESILQKAISGELTRHWRKVTNTSFEKYEFDLGDLANVTKLAGFEYSKYFRPEDHGDIAIIRAQNIRQGLFVEKNMLYIDKNTSNQLLRTKITGDELLMVNVGVKTGTVCIAPNGDYHLGPNVAKIKTISNEIHNEYLNIYFQSSLGKASISRVTKSTAQINLSVSDIRQIKIVAPSVKEQKEIARIADELISIVDNLKNKYIDSVDYLDKLNLSIIDKTYNDLLEVSQSEIDHFINDTLEEISSKKKAVELENKVLKQEQSKARSMNVKEKKGERSIIDILKDAPDKTLTVEEVWKQSEYFTQWEKNGYEEFYKEIERNMNVVREERSFDGMVVTLTLL